MLGMRLFLVNALLFSLLILQMQVLRLVPQFRTGGDNVMILMMRRVRHSALAARGQPQETVMVR